MTRTAATVALLAAIVTGGTLAGFAVADSGVLDRPSPRPHTDRTDLTRDECLALLMDGSGDSSGCYVGAGPDADTWLEPAASAEQCQDTTSPDPTPETGRSLCLVIDGPDRGDTFPIATT